MADSEQLLVTLGVQDKGTNKQINALTKELKSLDKEFKSANTVSKDFEKTQEGLKTKLTYLEKSYTTNKAKLDAYKKKIDETKESIKEKESELEKLNSEVDKDEKAVKKATEQLDRMKTTLRDTEKNVSLTENEMQRLTNEINETNTALENHALDEYKQKMQQLGESVQGTGEKISNFGSGMSTVGNSVMALSAPMVAFAGYAAKVGTDFEYGMKQVQATCGASQAELEKLSDKAKEVGENTKWSATDAAEGLNYMAMAGWKTEQMVAGLEPTVNLATAANTDLGTTCDIVTDALTAFGMTAEDTSHFTDIIASASSNANTNVEMLGESFKYVAPLCGSLKFSAEDSAIALGLMANAGIKSSQAGTSLKTALSNMVSPTDSMAGAMAQYNISVTDAEGNMKSLREIMDMLRTNMKSLSDEQINSNFEKYSQQIGMTRKEFEALGEDVQANILAETVGTEVTKNWSAEQMNSALAARFTKKELSKMTLEQKKWQLACMEGQITMYGLSEAEQAAAASTIFGKESMSGMLSIINASESDYQKLTNAIDNCEGTTKKMADTMANSTQGQIDNFESKCEALGIKIADGLLPHINDLLDKGMELIDWFSNLDEGTQQAIVKFGLLSFATGGLLSATGKVVSNVGGLVTWVGKLTSSAGESATTVGRLGLTLGNFGKIATPVGIAVAAVGSAVALYNKEQDALNNTVITAKEDMGFLEAALLSLNGVQVKNREELENAKIVYKEFGENIGEEFKNKVEESTKSIHDFNMKLKEITLDGVLSEEETTDFNSRVDECVNSALNTIESKKEQAQNSMQGLFTIDDGIIDKSEQQLIDFLTSEFEIEAEEVKKNQDAINNIYNTARKEGRTLKQDEIESIKQYYANIKQIELECQASNNSELEYSKIDFQNRVKYLDAKGASELLVQKKEQLNELIIQKENEYDQLIAVAQKKANEAKGEDQRIALEKLEELKKKKQETIDLYHSEWNEYKQIVETEAPGIVGKYSDYTGQILSDADVKAQTGINKMMETFDMLNGVTEDGWYRMRNTTTGEMEDIYVTVDKATGEVTGAWSRTTGIVGGLTDEMKQKVQQLGQEHEAEQIKINTALSGISGNTVNAKGQIIDAWGNVIATLKDVTVNENGVLQGITEINGKPMQIVTNADGVIVSMQDVKQKITDIPSSKSVTLNFISSGLSGIANTLAEIGKQAAGIKVDKNADGTTSYNGSGLSTINEKGWELASNNYVSILGTYNSNTLAAVPQGTGIRTHMQSVSDMKEAVSNEVSKQLNMTNNIFNKANLTILKNIAGQIGKVIVDGKTYNKEQLEAMAEQQEKIDMLDEIIDGVNGLYINDIWFGKESLKAMKEQQGAIEGLEVEGTFFGTEALQAMVEQQKALGDIKTEDEKKSDETKEQMNLNYGVEIEGNYYSEEALEAMKTIQDGIEGIIANGLFFSKAGIEAMKYQQYGDKVDNLATTYYEKDSEEAKEVIKQSTSNSKSIEFDYDRLAQANMQALMNILEKITPPDVNVDIDVDVDADGIVNKAVNKTMDKIDRKSKMKKVIQGR